jgi:hypothetical protein
MDKLRASSNSMSAVRLPATQRRAGGQVSTLHCCSISAELKFCNMNLAARSPPRSSNAVKYGFVTLVVKRPVSSAADAVNGAAPLGDLTPSEASEEATDFAERLDKLERMTNR